MANGALDPFSVQVGLPNSNGSTLSQTVAVRAGGPGLTVTAG